MAVTIQSLIAPVRRQIDPEVLRTDEFVVDGTQYVFTLENRPVVSGSITATINHVTYTSGVNQVVPSGFVGMARGFHYTHDLDRAQMTFLSGIYPTGVPFKPWNSTVVTFNYTSTTYTDNVIAQYIIDAVPVVESHLNLGYKVQDNSPSGSDPNDELAYHDIGGVTATTVVPEPLQLVQTLIIKETIVLINERERRLGVKGNQGMSIRDGDIEINTGNTFRASESITKDLKSELKNLYAEIKLNMDCGIGIVEQNERYMRRGGDANIDYTDPDYFREYENYNNPFA